MGGKGTGGKGEGRERGRDRKGTGREGKGQEGEGRRGEGRRGKVRMGSDSIPTHSTIKINKIAGFRRVSLKKFPTKTQIFRPSVFNINSCYKLSFHLMSIHKYLVRIFFMPIILAVLDRFL